MRRASVRKTCPTSITGSLFIPSDSPHTFLRSPRQTRLGRGGRSGELGRKHALPDVGDFFHPVAMRREIALIRAVLPTSGCIAGPAPSPVQPGSAVPGPALPWFRLVRWARLENRGRHTLVPSTARRGNHVTQARIELIRTSFAENPDVRRALTRRRSRATPNQAKPGQASPGQARPGRVNRAARPRVPPAVHRDEAARPKKTARMPRRGDFGGRSTHFPDMRRW